MQRLAISLVVLTVLAGCQRQDPEALARAQGLVPPEVDLSAPTGPAKPPGTDTRLGQMLALSNEYADATLPRLPPPPRLSYAEFVSRSSYNGWETDRIDASSFDSLTNSLNAILQKMVPTEAEDFDRVVKYVLMQVTRDPMVAKKAVGGGQMSDSDLLRAIQSYVHDRTPRDITNLAEQFYKRQQAQQQGSGNRGGSAMGPSTNFGAGP